MRKQKAKRIQSYAFLAVLALTVAVGTSWLLKRPASTISGSVICGQEAHTHSEACYARVLGCGLEESDTHTHTEQCQTLELACAKQEHIHDDSCYDTEPEPEPELPQEGDGSVSDVPQMLRQSVPEDYTDVRTAALPSGGTVYVFARPGSIPGQAQLRAQVIDPSDPVFAQAQQRVQESGLLYDHFTALDISLVDELGSEVEPQDVVYVSIDGGSLLPPEISPQSIGIQHHRELGTAGEQLVSDRQEPAVQLETVVDETKGILMQDGAAGSWTATFPVDSFSVYTITSAGWESLNIQVQCVDETANELIETHKPNDIRWGSAYTPQASFNMDFTSSNHPNIEGYVYDGKTYYMEDNQYKHRIYGLRRQDGKWYYFHNDSNTAYTLFEPQPDFEGENPRNTIRSVYKKIMQIPVMYLDDAGSASREEIPLPTEDAPNRRNPDTITYKGTTLDISNADLLPKSPKYFFVGRAYVEEPTPHNEVRTVIRQDGTAHAVTVDGRTVPLSEQTPLKLLYHQVQTDLPGTIETVSTRDKGMIINLFAYNSGPGCGPDEGINAGKKLQFINKANRPDAYNRWTGKDGGVYTGIVEKELVNGYPVISGDKSPENQSLDYLFDPELCKAELGKPDSVIKHVHTNLDHLFWIDQNGYYHYNAMTNFATIMDPSAEGGGHRPDHIDGGNFVVYQQPALPGVPGTGDNPKFLPFNTYEQANRPTHNPAIQEKIKNYHFGMTLETEFIMPPNGQVPNVDGNEIKMTDMIFEFNGDDDVWVFIDGKLALDLGGIHDRYGGTINFRTGEVTTNAPPMEHSGLRQPNLYGIADISQVTEDELVQIRIDKGFGKFSKHTIKFFYLERGRGASNCEIKFNLVPVDHKLAVGKRYPANAEAAVEDNQWHKFQVEVVDPKLGRYPLANNLFTVVGWRPDDTIVTGGRPIRADITDQNGCFWLRAGERADFVGDVDLKNAGTEEKGKIRLYVREIVDEGKVPPKAWSGKANAKGTYVEAMDPNGQTRKLIPPLYDSEKHKYHTAQTERPLTRTEAGGKVQYEAELTTGRDNEFNWVDFENDVGDLATLTVSKQAFHVGGTVPIPDVPFKVKVELWDRRLNTWRPLNTGSKYWILQSGQTEPPAGTEPQRLTAEQRGIILLQHDQTAYFKLIPGTKYRVTEILTDGDETVYTPSYEGTVQNPNGQPEELELYKAYRDQEQKAEKPLAIGSKDGVLAGSRHGITITNIGDITVPPELHIKKVVEGFAPADMPFDIQIKIGKQEDALLPLPAGTPYTVTVNGVQEDRSVTGENGVVQIHAGEIIHLKLEPGTAYSVEEINRNKGFEVEYQLDVTKKEWTRSASSQPLKHVAQRNEIHTITVTNRGDAVVTPKGSFVLEKQLTGQNLPPQTTKFPFRLRIVGYVTDQASGGYLPSLECQATYYGTPAGGRPELGLPQYSALTGKVSFLPETTQGGQTPTRGEGYSTELFLYPGESVVITGLPVGYAMYVSESLSEEDAANYDVSFREPDGRVTAGRELAATAEKIQEDRVVQVLCRNESKILAGSTLQITKLVKRTDRPDGAPSQEDRAESFHFQITLKEPAAFQAGEVRAEIRKENGTAEPQTLTFRQERQNYVTEITLRHGETMVITGLPSGIDVIVRETEHAGYAVSMNRNPGDTVTVHLKPNSGAPYEVECVNMTGVKLPATGGHGTWPWYLAGTMLLWAAGWLLHHRKRKQEAL